MTQALQALIFDLDGTLADTEEAHRQAFNEAFLAFNLGWDWDPKLYKHLLTIAGGKERLFAYAPAPQQEILAGLHAETLAKLHAEKTKRYRAKVVDGEVGLRPGVAHLINEAKASGLKLGLASTTSRANVKELLNVFFRKGNPFQAIVAGEDVKAKKPDPEVYLKTLAKLGVAPQAALAIEDSVPGLKAATAAGIRCLITPCPWTEGDNFSQAALVRPDLQGLTLSDLQALLT
ncbi:MAG: HAD-IA family hydrolase [Alphaproteobacteria bacterium]|nr:HAD-IA family hydrolase [Alphaproteobacteria bacterium]